MVMANDVLLTHDIDHILIMSPQQVMLEQDELALLFSTSNPTLEFMMLKQGELNPSLSTL